MSQPALNDVLRYLHGLFATEAGSDLSDGELLEQFRASREETAFAILVQRHGSMVMNVCARVLKNAHAAEDAFQATFLVLVRKSASLCNHRSLGPWLYGVARRIALRARAQESTRRDREGRAAKMPRAEVLDELTWKELRSVLDEEIGSLPERYRAPVILCYLEGKSHEQSARELGWPKTSLEYRLTRAREMLRKRLERRGIALSGAALIGALTQNAVSAAVPAQLTISTVKGATLLLTSKTAAAGALSAKAILLEEEAMKSLLGSKVTVLAVLLATGLVAGGTGFALQKAGGEKAAGVAAADGDQFVVAPAKEPQEKGDNPPAEEEAETLTAAGRVLDPDGKPVAGARLYYPRWTRQPFASEHEFAVAPCGTTHKDGRFALTLPRKESRPGQPVALIATADGFGLAWVHLGRTVNKAEIILQLVKDVPIRGRVLNTEGKPIAGVTIHVNEVMIPNQVDEFLNVLSADLRAGQALARRLALPLTPLLRVTEIDKDGRFEVRGVGEERLAKLRLSSNAAIQDDILVFTREGLDLRPVPGNTLLGVAASRLHGATFGVVAEANQLMEGIVREAETNKPVPGATVRALAFAPRGVSSSRTIVSDAQGSFRILGLRKADRYQLSVTPPADAPLVGGTLVVKDTPGYFKTIKADLELPRGVVISGRVVDKTTGKGVESSVQYYGNPVKKPSGNVNLGAAVGTFSDADGRFQFAVPPGSGVLAAAAVGSEECMNSLYDPYLINPYLPAEWDAEDGNSATALNLLRRSEPGNFNVLRALEIKDGSDKVSCDLAVTPGKTLTMKIVDPDGKPQDGVLVRGVSAMDSVFLRQQNELLRFGPTVGNRTRLPIITLRHAECEVHGLDPSKPRKLYFLYPEREWFAVVTVRGDEQSPVPVRLQRMGTVTGCLKDTTGKTMQYVRVTYAYSDNVGSELLSAVRRRWPITPGVDGNGRFRVGGLLPGMKFEFYFYKSIELGGLTLDSRRILTAPEAGETVDLGDFQVKAE
ncbi:MAG: sigma-70 family RNA polymerase sigma factor [Gemmataceae bacterium]|nr:sigma-70 family RNA polymerase sigma factor [Gemmataceae bacterium]